MERLVRLIGRERSLAEVSQTLHFWAQSVNAGTAGAVHVTCADESENECVEAFQRGFAQYVLPRLKFAREAPMRLASLGGHYQWGAIHVANDHFVGPAMDGHFKLMVIKVNSHVALEDRPAAGGDSSLGPVPFRFGTWTRYGRDSACCGALTALLGGSQQPFAQELRETFSAEAERVRTLLDEQKVPPSLRMLYAAVISAKLQARKAVLEIQEHKSDEPVLFLVMPCVTLNKHDRDTEIVCGLYTIDTRGERVEEYRGLGDDPAAFVIERPHRFFAMSDEHVGTRRKARDHRKLVLETWKKRSTDSRSMRDARLERIREDVSQNRHRGHHHAKALLRAALPILAEVAPVPAAVLMFAHGAAGIHHAFRVHRLVREMEGSHEAREILDEIHARVDQLNPDRAEALIEILMSEYGR